MATGLVYPSTAKEPATPGLPGTWNVSFSGAEVVWRDFFTGPIALPQEQLVSIARELLGLGWDEVPAAAQRELVPFVADGRPHRALLLHSATPVLKSLEADLSDTANGRAADDVAAYVETRSVSLAQAGDLCVGRTLAWQQAVKLAGVDAVDVSGLKYYYLSHALLSLAAETNGQAEALVRIAEWLRAHPDALVRLYALDRELQVVLLYLKRMAGLDYLAVDANSPVIGDYWNTKGPIHPDVEDALGLATTSADPLECLAAESDLAPMARRLAIHYERLPGYTVRPHSDTLAVTEARLAAAADLLKRRHGLSLGCLKPSEGGAGARITAGISLDDSPRLAELAGRIHSAQGDFLLEANMNYATTNIAGLELRLAPSAHVRYGSVPDGVTLQIVKGTSWQGNIFVDEAVAPEVGLSVAEYHAMIGMTEKLRSAFDAIGLKLVTGGIDYAVGTVAGAYGDRRFVAFQDPNLSSHGAEYLRLFLDRTADSGLGRYGATKVVRPTPLGTLATLNAAPAPTSCVTTVISTVPGRWGMLAALGHSPASALRSVLEYERSLIEGGLLLETAPR